MKHYTEKWLPKTDKCTINSIFKSHSHTRSHLRLYHHLPTITTSNNNKLPNCWRRQQTGTFFAVFPFWSKELCFCEFKNLSSFHAAVEPIGGDGGGGCNISKQKLDIPLHIHKNALCGKHIGLYKKNMFIVLLFQFVDIFSE